MEITAKVKTYEFCKALLSFLSYLYGILHLIIHPSSFYPSSIIIITLNWYQLDSDQVLVVEGTGGD